MTHVTDADVWAAQEVYREHTQAKSFTPYAHIIRAVLLADRTRTEAAVRGDERERCAKIADECHRQDEIDNGVAMTGAAAIAAAAIRAASPAVPAASGWRPISEAKEKTPLLVFHRGEYRVVELHSESDPDVESLLPPGAVVDPRAGRIWTAQWFHPLPSLPGTTP